MKVLITGGAGTLGSAICKILSRLSEISEIVIFSRSEDPQFKLKSSNNFNNVNYIIGDIRDYDWVLLATRGVDLIIHSAAMKHIDIAEENPLEASEINVSGTANIIKAAQVNNVKEVFFISTDKASNPSGIYGVSKLMGEKLAILSSNDKTKISVFRFGNIVGSNGSIFQKWPEQIRANQKISVTDKDMTRFFIDQEDAAQYVVDKIGKTEGKEIFIPKMEKKKIFDIAMFFAKDIDNINIIGLRENEKMHECILSDTEVGKLVEHEDEYVITPGNAKLPNICSEF